jgi:hypothetical protein
MKSLVLGYNKSLWCPSYALRQLAGSWASQVLLLHKFDHLFSSKGPMWVLVADYLSVFSLCSSIHAGQLHGQ